LSHWTKIRSTWLGTRRLPGAVSLVICLVCAWVLGPLCTLAHEFGHAVVALRSADGPVRISVGGRRWAARLRIGRIRISFSPCGLGGLCSYRGPELTRREHLRRTLAGPAANLILAVALLPPLLSSDGVLHVALLTAVAVNAAMALGNLVPLPGRLAPVSDGRQMWSLLRR
jgi:hypothetical protein